jgi:hypothetical protein
MIFHVTFVAFLTAILLYIVIVFVNVAHHISKGTCFCTRNGKVAEISHFISHSLVAHITVMRFIVCQCRN